MSPISLFHHKLKIFDLELLFPTSAKSSILSLLELGFLKCLAVFFSLYVVNRQLNPPSLPFLSFQLQNNQIYPKCPRADSCLSLPPQPKPLTPPSMKPNVLLSNGDSFGFGMKQSWSIKNLLHLKC